MVALRFEVVKPPEGVAERAERRALCRNDA
jgi:hypothetical protein